MPDLPEQRVAVALDKRGYDIVIGEDLLARCGEYLRDLLPQKRAIILTDAHVAKHYLAPVQASLSKAGIAQEAITVAPGEGSKSYDTFADVVEQVLGKNPERKTSLIALGGGVIGDLTGFAASVVLRGIPFVQLPTTLLAQVDSSVGGKTGINSRHGKNLIGSFYQPRLVLADMKALATLPKRELLAGYAEVVKYGLINDYGFVVWLEENGEKLLSGDRALLARAVKTSCQAKAAIVAQDEKEADVRALLNLGHTFGHALEAETGYGEALVHGEAVAIGMVMAFEFSARRGLCSAADAARVKAHLAKVGLPVTPLDVRPNWDVAALVRHCQHDKKVQDGTLTFILARGIGQSFISRDIRADELAMYFTEHLKGRV